ncbi:DUF89 domain-containing protein [Elusimicrobiota bacterium]
MKTYLECIPCFFRQALESSKIAGLNEVKQREVLNKLAVIIQKFPLSWSPPEAARGIYKIITKVSGKSDPYIDIKNKSNRKALSIYYKLKKKVKHSRDSLLTAIELAIAGNVIDYGVKNSLNVDQEIRKIMAEESRIIKKENKAIFNYAEFKKHLKKAKKVLYLADNAGETVFDRILIEEIKRIDGRKQIVYAVKEKPIINDALRHDALICGINNTAEIISSGSDAPGIVISLCNKKFLKLFKEADLIISKGQGNFEALSDSKRPIFFLFMAKCPVIVRDVCERIGKCELGNINLFYSNNKIRRRLK